MGETAHRRGAYRRGRPGEFKGLLRQGKLMGLMECRRVAHSPSRPLTHSPPGSWIPTPLLITDPLITDYFEPPHESRIAALSIASSRLCMRFSVGRYPQTRTCHVYDFVRP